MSSWRVIDGYEMVIGLEVHVELKTKTKIFCSCSTKFGAKPNTQCCPVCMGFPGTLPVLNREVVHYAAIAGLATGCKIANFSKFDRKNYFYPDLPKAYQISQYDLPLCTEGKLTISTENGEKAIGITRIHMEEDAGKLIHSKTDGTLIDCNRCGVPLIEIVSEPDIRTPQEAVAYLRKLKAILTYTGISDCKMNEGSLRCDVNLSIHQKDKPFGTRTEMKNLNSFQSVQRAIEEEYSRQVQCVKNGEEIVQETRRYDQATGKTSSMRRKENANDYRYFPDPDLPPVEVSEEKIALWRSELPVLPDERKAGYIAKGISPYVAEQLTSEKYVADFFDRCEKETKATQILANLMLSEIFRLREGEDSPILLSPEQLSCVVDMVEDGRISNSAAKKVIAALWNTSGSAEEYVEKNKLMQICDEVVLTEYANMAIVQNPQMVSGYVSGKSNLEKAMMGAAMSICGGRANPGMLQKIIHDSLEKIKNDV